MSGTVRRRGMVWVVNQYANPPDTPAGSRHFELARQLVARGHDVVIFAAGFSHATHREERLSGRRLYATAVIDGVRFVWLRTIPYGGNTWQRPLNMITFLAAFLVVQSRFPRPRTIIGSTVHPLAALGAWIAAKWRGARFVFEIRDLWPQTLVDLGEMRAGSPVERVLRALEAFLVRHASAVISLLPGIGDYLREQGLPTGHVVYLPNGVNLRSFDARTVADEAPPEPVLRCLEAIRALRDTGRFVVGYVGSFGRVNRVEVTIEAAGIAERAAPGRVALVLVGAGAERAAVEATPAAGDGVVFCPAIPRTYVPMVLHALDATVVHATWTPVYRYGISFNKLFEYMAAGRPIVFACASAYDPVAGARAGISVAPDDPEVIARAYIDLANAEPGVLADMGAAGRAYVDREHNIERLGEILASVVAEPSGEVDQSRPR